MIVSRYGHRQSGGGFGLSPTIVEHVLKGTATRKPCPTPPAFTYTRITPASGTLTATHTCEGTTANNGFYGRGIVNALRAIGH